MSAPIAFTVVIPTFNRADKLERTLRTILAMPDDPSFEVIVVDQSTDDATQRLVASLGNVRVRCVHMTQRGRGAAMHTGVALARGRFVAGTDDDVLIPRDWLVRVRAAFERYGCDAVMGRIVSYGEPPGPGYEDPSSCEWVEDVRLAPATLRKGFGASQVFRRSAILAIGNYDSRLGIGGPVGGTEDYDAVYRALMRGMTVMYCADVCIEHDGWELRDVRERKWHVYGRSRMAVVIKDWLEVGGPALRVMFVQCGGLLVEGLANLACGNLGLARYCLGKLWHFLRGVPLGLRLVFDDRLGRPRYGADFKECDASCESYT